MIYGSLVCSHRWLYRIGLLVSTKFDFPIISIGNLSLGGTGKSPHTAYFQELLNPFFKIGMVSRGYHRKSKGVLEVNTDSSAVLVGDEPLEFKLNHVLCPVFVAEKRAAGVQTLLQKHPSTNCILLDDALQHWAIKPSVQVVLTTFEKPFFDDWTVPLGRLREFRSGYQRADIIIVSKCPKDINEAQKQYFIQKIAPLRHQQVYFSFFCYNKLYHLLDPTIFYSLSKLKQAAVLVVSALANSQSLKNFVSKNSLDTRFLDFADHHYYTEKDLILIQQKAENRIVIITQKDASKLLALKEQILDLKILFYVLPITVEIAFGEEFLLKKRLLELTKYSL